MAKVLYETIRDEGMTDEALYRGFHRAIRALRDRCIEIRRVTSESGITAVHHNGTEAVEVHDNRIETVQEDGNWLKATSEDGLQDTTTAEGGASATATQTDGRLICEKEGIEVMNDTDKNAKVGDKNCRRAVGGNEDDRTREERDATLVDDEENETGQEDPRYWAPYIHFGV